MEPAPRAAENSKLRHVEKDVLIPQIMREKAKERCSDKVQGNCSECTGIIGNKAILQKWSSCCNSWTKNNNDEPLALLCQHNFHIAGCVEISPFTKCCKETGLLMVVKCRQENTALKDCLVSYYTDPAFYEECKTEYLKQREEYRATGIKKKKQKLSSNV